MKRIIKKIQRKRSVLRMCISIGALMLLMVTTVFASPKMDVAVFINGKEQAIPSNMGEIFVDSQARTQVPLRFISERLGHKVDWDEKKQQVAIDVKAIILKIGDKNIKVNGKTVIMDTAPITIKGRTYVPVRFIAEGLGHTVEYKNISGKNVVWITTSGEVPVIPSEPDKGNVGGNYNPEEVPTYKYPETQYGYDDETKHWIDPVENIGSNERNTHSRAPGTAYIDDLAYLNSLMGNTMYGWAKDGRLSMPGGKNSHIDRPVGSPYSIMGIGYWKDSERRSVKVGGFLQKKHVNPEQGAVSLHNIMVEAVKYFSKSTDDGKAILAYASRELEKDKWPEFGKVMTFGNTKVEFEKLSSAWGFIIHFLE